MDGAGLGFGFMITGDVAGGCEIARMPETVSEFETSELLLLLLGKGFVGGASIGKVSVSRPGSRNDVGKEKRV